MGDLIEGFVSLLNPSVRTLNLCKHAKKGDVKGARKLLQKNQEITANSKNADGLTPLHVAVLNKKYKFAEWLLQEVKVSIDSTENENLYTPLHLCIKNELWDQIIWLVEHGADWDAPAQCAGETPMDLLEASGNNRFLMKFKDACDRMKGKREKDKREAARPKAKHPEPVYSSQSASPPMQQEAAPRAPPPATTISSTTSASTGAGGGGGGGGMAQFTSATVQLVKAVKQFQATCQSGNQAAYQSEATNLQQLFASYKPQLRAQVAAVPAQAAANAQESEQVLGKGLAALGTVGKAVAYNPGNVQAAGKLTQVSDLIDKHFKRLIAIVIKKQY